MAWVPGYAVDWAGFLPTPSAFRAFLPSAKAPLGAGGCPAAPSHVPRRQDDAGGLGLHICGAAPGPVQPPAEMRPAVGGVPVDHVAARNGDPGAADQQAHDRPAVTDGLDEVPRGAAVPGVATGLPVAILEGSVVHSAVAHVRSCGG